MAISIDATTNMTEIDAGQNTTGWTYSGFTKTGTDTAIQRHGSSCVYGQVQLNSFGYGWHTHSSSVNLTTAGNERVYVWVKPSAIGTEAQKGAMVVIGDTSGNRIAYVIGGSDNVPFSVKGWYCFMLDTANLPTSYNTLAGTEASLDLTAIDEFGWGIYNIAQQSGQAPNCFHNGVRYGSGIIVTSGATDDITFADIAAEDASSTAGKHYGIIREIQPGVYGVQGDIILGDGTGTNSIDLKDDSAVVIFEDRVVGSGTNTKFQFSGAHNSTGTFSLELGIAVGSGDSESGRSGVTFLSANPANQPIDFDFSDTDIEDVFLYGCSFINMRGGNIDFSADATNGISHHISGCSFEGCSQVGVGRAVVRNSLFAATGDAQGALIWNDNIDIKNCDFIGNTTGPAIEHETIESVYAGNCTNTGSETTTLHDSGGGFTANVDVGDYVYNETDGSYGQITSKDSDTQLTHGALAGGTNNYWTNNDAYSISPAQDYNNLSFSGNTTDVDNNATGGDALFVTKSNGSDPITTEGTVELLGSVTITVTVKDTDGNVISGVQTAVYKTSDRTELMNEDTNASGVASEAYTGATPVEVEIRCRKASSGTTKYKNFSSVQTIGSGGLDFAVTLVEDQNNNATT